MKKTIHPKYQKVLFVDSASGYRFVCGSTLETDAKEVFEGVEYPVCYLSISSASHPFFTGSKQLVDSEGRVEKFKKRFGKSGSQFDHNAEIPESATNHAHAAPAATHKKAEPAKKAAAPVNAKAPANAKAAPANAKADQKKPAAPADKKAPEKKGEKPAVAKKK